MMDKWVLLGKIKSSLYRQKILEDLLKEVKTPKQLCKNTNLNFSHISKYLKELHKWKLIECVTPKLRKGKIYAITKLGRDILKRIKDMN